jgi:hypothetical protein
MRLYLEVLMVLSQMFKSGRPATMARIVSSGLSSASSSVAMAAAFGGAYEFVLYDYSFY